MRISLTELHRPKSFKLTGNEDWLARLYGDFPLGRERALSGTLEIAIGHGGEVNVRGKLDFAPTVSCSRCERNITWPLSVDVDARFLPDRGSETKREHTLTQAELDAYYIEQGEIDLEQLLTDLVQTQLPTQLVRANEDETACVVCHDDLTRDLVFGVGNKEPEKAASPFAALKDLKLKK